MQPSRVLSSSELIQIFREEDKEVFSRIGQVLRAQVIERLSESRFLLKFGERLILAETTIPLKEREDIQVRVEALRPRIILKLLSPQNAEVTSGRFLIRALSLEDLASLWTRLMEKHLSVNNHHLVQDLHQILNTLLADTHKLKQKTFWQYLGRMLLGDPGEGTENSPLQKNLFSLLGLIGEKNENKQIIIDVLNHFMTLKAINYHLKQDGIYLQLPYIWPEGPKTIEIFIGKEKRKKKRNKPSQIYFIHFRLELSNLKKIEVMLRLAGENDLFVNFKVEDKAVVNLIQQDGKKLEEMLAALDFQIKEFRCEVVPREYWRDFCLNWLDLKEGLIDMKA